MVQKIKTSLSSVFLVSVIVVTIVLVAIIILVVVKSERDRFYDFEDFKDVCFVNPKSWFSFSKITEDIGFTKQRVKNGLGNFYRYEFLLNPKDFKTTVGRGLSNPFPHAKSALCEELKADPAHLIVIKTYEIKRFCDEVMFAKVITTTTTCPFVLVAGDCDDSPSKFEKEIRFLLKHKNLLKMYCQNLDVSFSDPKLEPIPIGVNYHDVFFNQNKTISSFIFGATKNDPKFSPKCQEEELLDVKRKLPHPSERPPLAYTSATLNMTDDTDDNSFKSNPHHPYKGLRKELKNRKAEFEGVITFQETRIPRVDTWKKHGDYLFIVSPPGAGIDCFRTWEALILGNIPILIKTPPFTETTLFDGLPVVFIENYSEITIENMKKWKNEFLVKFETYNFSKLTIQYWMDEIFSLF